MQRDGEEPPRRYDMLRGNGDDDLEEGGLLLKAKQPKRGSTLLTVCPFILGAFVFFFVSFAVVRSIAPSHESITHG